MDSHAEFSLARFSLTPNFLACWVLSHAGFSLSVVLSLSLDFLTESCIARFAHSVDFLSRDSLAGFSL